MTNEVFISVYLPCIVISEKRLVLKHVYVPMGGHLEFLNLFSPFLLNYLKIESYSIKLLIILNCCTRITIRYFNQLPRKGILSLVVLFSSTTTTTART